MIHVYIYSILLHIMHFLRIDFWLYQKVKRTFAIRFRYLLILRSNGAYINR